MNNSVEKKIVDTLRKNGFRATLGKVAIFSLLENAKKPISLSEISQKINLDSANVFRTLRDFEKVGLVTSSKLGSKSMFYELVLNSEHHHHIICSKCGLVEDVNIEHKDILQKVLKKSIRFKKLEKHEIEFFGVCNSCSKS